MINSNFYIISLLLCLVFKSDSSPNVTPSKINYNTIIKFNVTENRKKDTGKTIELSYIRYKSTNPNPGSPIIYLAGGPSSSGINTIRGSQIAKTLLSVADVIAFDQRGTGSSSLINYSRGWSYPLDEATNLKTLKQMAKACGKKASAFWRAKGIDLSAYNTEESADDIEALRKEIGANKITLWGNSYGTHLALAYVKKHEKSLGRVLLTGVEGPNHTVKSPKNTQILLERIDSILKQDGRYKNQYPDFLGDIKTVLERLDHNPVNIKVSGKNLVIGKFDIQQATTDLLAAPFLFDVLPKYYRQMVQGNYSGLAPRLLRNRRTGNFNAMWAAMDAASGISKERKKRIEIESKNTLMQGAINLPWTSFFEGIEVPDLGDDFRENPKSNIPLLCVSGFLDGRTPPSNAVEILKGFPKGNHIVIKNKGHGGEEMLTSSNKVKSLVIDFLNGTAIGNHTVKSTRIKFN